MDRQDGINKPDQGLGALPLSILSRIDTLADAYEKARLAGESPDIDAFVQRLGDEGGTACAILRQQLEGIDDEATSLSSRHVANTPKDAQSAPNQVRIRTMQLANSKEALDEQQIVGEYQLLERLGSGGMGVVFKALHLRLGCHVAIKFPRFVELLEKSYASRLLREARVVGRLRHEHIVRALDAGDSPLGPYLVTEFIAGGTVSELVRNQGPLQVACAIELTRQAATALAYSHAAGVVHRDIKPPNLLLDEGQVIRVVDFGLAKPQDLAEFDPDASEATQPGAFLGTVAYAAPEQLLPVKDREVDERADQYSLGCVLHFMLTGQPPHGSDLPERLLEERGSITSSLSRLCPDVPTRVDELWRRMVAHEPGQRFGNMAELVKGLESVQSNPGASTRLVAGRRRFWGFGLTAAILASGFYLALQIAPIEKAIQQRRGPRPQTMEPPFTAVEAAEGQESWAKYLGKQARVTNSVGMELVLVPPGAFEMGHSEGEPEPRAEPDSWRYKSVAEVRVEQSPRHRVVISQPFYMATTEVTFAQFEQFVDASAYVTDAERTSGWGKEDRGWLKRVGYSWKNTGQRVSADDYPVVNVTWNDAVALCKWLTQHDGRGRYRLPSEAEWEYACRAGTTTPYFFGEEPAAMGDHAWFADNFGEWIHSVAGKRPNPFGLFDLYGNRQEWCQDTFHADFYSESPEKDPVCLEEGDLRSLRGGAHTDAAWFCTSARRWGQEPDNIGAAGIRVVCEVLSGE